MLILPLPVTTLLIMSTLWVAVTVIFTSLLPLLCGLTIPVVLVFAKGSVLYDMMEPVVGFDEESLMTWMFPLRYQLLRIVRLVSADATSNVMICAFPSARMGRNGVRSTLYVG